MAIQDKRGFADTLAGDIAKLEIALEEEPWLKNDFQAVIDPEGYVHLFDLTRPCVGSICSNEGAGILNGLRSLVLAVSGTEKVEGNELVKSCVPDGTFH